MKAPFPWFGGKSTVSDLVWERFGAVANYVEPFFGSGAVLLNRPDFTGTETVNDKDGFLANFWRAIQHAPDEVARYTDWPVNENDLHARHSWLVNRKAGFTAQLEGDPDFFDAKVAGYWVWGICSWIGGGWCSGNGPWYSQDGLLLDNRKIPNLGNAGRGVRRRLPHLFRGMGVNRKLPHLGTAGRGGAIAAMFGELSERLRDVRVCCGDWTRVMGDSVTILHAGVTGVFLDPPYSDKANRTANIYAEDCLNVAHDVREWAIANGGNPELRIALCGYEGEHDFPESWVCVPWKAQGGYASKGETTGRENADKERIWFSPHCLRPDEQRGWIELECT